jgi:hypothetical protein
MLPKRVAGQYPERRKRTGVSATIRAKQQHRTGRSQPRKPDPQPATTTALHGGQAFFFTAHEYWQQKLFLRGPACLACAPPLAEREIGWSDSPAAGSQACYALA